MTRLASVLLCTFVVCLATAAPAPDVEPFVTGWDKPVDPDHDCDFLREKGKLTITVPGKDHDLGVERGRMNAPRLLRDVEGDFIVQVRVGGAFQPTIDSDADDRISFQGAGLLLLVDEKTYIRLERAALSRSGKAHRYANFELRQNAEWVRAGEATILPLADEETHLRLERKGDKVLGAVSQDGKKWSDLEPMDIKLPTKVKVGVAAVTTSTTEFAPTFSQFELSATRK